MMGEYANMMINGALCEWCGVAVGDEVGYARKCQECAVEAWIDERRQYGEDYRADAALRCPHCGKRLKSAQGVNDHVKAVHALGGE